MSNAETYIIAAWLEGKEWRYRVRHVHSGEESHASRLEDVANLLEQRTGVSPLAPARTRESNDEANRS